MCKDAAPPSDGHGNLGRMVDLVLTHWPSPGLLMGMLLCGAFF